MAHMVLERCEVEHAMSWLSTLGGAFSALGENVEHCVSFHRNYFTETNKLHDCSLKFLFRLKWLERFQFINLDWLLDWGIRF